MRSGRAVVVTDLPALAEIVDDGKTGRLYPVGDVNALVEVVEELLGNEEIREQLGQNAQSWIIANRTWQSVTCNALEVYNKLVNNS